MRGIGNKRRKRTGKTDRMSHNNAPQVALLGHFWSHWHPYQNFQFSIFLIITETQPEVDAMRLRDVTAYRRSHTKCPPFSF